jgi:fatty acid desaturase
LSSPNAELITLGLAGLIPAAFVCLTLSYGVLPHWLFALLCSLLLTLYGSLQHETIHGHPTRPRRFNAMLGALPLALWMLDVMQSLFAIYHRRWHR